MGSRMSRIRTRIERKIDEAVDRVKQSREYAEPAESGLKNTTIVVQKAQV